MPPAAGARRRPLPPDAAAETEPPLPVRDLVGYQLRRAHTLFALHWQQAFRGEGPHVTPMQAGMLMTLSGSPGLTQAALARLMDVEGPTLLQALDKLERNGLVRRERRPDDRRAYALHLTPQGEAAAGAARRFVPEREDALLADLSAGERTLLLDLLQRVVRRSHEVIADLASQPGAAAVRNRKEDQP
ncbi:MarR family transcriptional regulator [Roseomonas sp. OT10]|uniref:MarR family winged helix-turn-helix transcriptional regulator n=1 Tax=Roseomonas cutis TaxID=2897332 RepID=UPI001E325AB4|nr:MarR family transcriptional regulator [Roseomonas sp. OT10]UFN50278.1 MarR family transcriptional regulator [Roseomonas sp. OT10]